LDRLVEALLGRVRPAVLCRSIIICLLFLLLAVGPWQ